jgi:hypothetical protein
MNSSILLLLLVESATAGAINCLVQQALLEGVGVGSPGGAAAGGLAVAVQWVLKEGVGDIGKIIFTNRFSRTFDLRPKSWKFWGEWVSSAGSLLMIGCCVAPPSYFLPLAGVGTAMRAIAWLCWTSSTTFFEKHFARKNNLADVVAKLDSQTVLAHLMGIAVGINIIQYDASPAFLFGSFLVLFPLQIVTSYYSLKAITFSVLNQGRALDLSQEFLTKGPILKPLRQYQSEEKYFGEWITSRTHDIPRVRQLLCAYFLHFTFYFYLNINHSSMPIVYFVHHHCAILLHTCDDCR